MKKTPLKRKKGLNPQSPRVRDRNQAWKEICLWRINYLVAKYGYIKCEYCGKRGSVDCDSVLAVWGHHMDEDRDNCQLSNCYICHHTCHDQHIQYKLEVKQEGFEGVEK